MNNMKKTLTVLLPFIVVIPLAFLCGWVTSLLWNWLMPVIFGLPDINALQALGLILLSSALFCTVGRSEKNG